MKYRGLTAAAVAQSREKYGADTMPEPVNLLPARW